MRARVGQGEPERADDGEEGQVGQLLLNAMAGERHVQRLGLDLVGGVGGDGGAFATAGATGVLIRCFSHLVLEEIKGDWGAKTKTNFMSSCIIHTGMHSLSVLDFYAAFLMCNS